MWSDGCAIKPEGEVLLSDDEPVAMMFDVIREGSDFHSTKRLCMKRTIKKVVAIHPQGGT
jgi:hypothetical protein